MELQDQVEVAVGRAPSMVRWSLSIRRDGSPRAEIAPGEIMRTASMGKVFLLAEVARRLVDGSLDPSQPLAASAVAPVADSGLWQHFRDVPLSAAAAAVLVGAVSDNLATNVLLDVVSIDAVRRMSERLGMPGTGMLDRIRDVRLAGDPPDPSVGCAGDLADFMGMVSAGTLLDERVSGRVREWLSSGTDLSMVASALDLDPLAHAEGQPRLFNKTGTDHGIRADAGVIDSGHGSWAYAVIANWDPSAHGPAAQDPTPQVLRVMRSVGGLISQHSRVT
jgi:beta-lactamase class A